MVEMTNYYKENEIDMVLPVVFSNFNQVQDLILEIIKNHDKT